MSEEYPPPEQKQASTPAPRGTPSQERFYCWQSKKALEAIDKSPHVTSRAVAKLVYLALTWISSNQKNTPSFRTTRQLIADMASVSTRAATTAFQELQATGVIRINHTKKEGSKHYDLSTYTLLSIGNTFTPRANQVPTGERKKRGRNFAALFKKQNSSYKEESSVSEKDDNKDLHTPNAAGADARGNGDANQSNPQDKLKGGFQ